MPDDKNESRHLIARRELSNERRNQVFEMLFRMPVTNTKFTGPNFAVACVQFVNELTMKALSQANGSLTSFLRENPWPSEMMDDDLFLSEQDRAKVVVLNAVKQWLSKEALWLDMIFTGGRFREKLRELCAERNCRTCQRPFSQLKIELHHTVRDGRPPVPICSECHQTLENQSPVDQPPISDVKRIRASRNASWKNLLKATKSLQGLPHDPFSTPNVENASKSIVRLIVRETKLSLPELQRIIEKQIRIQEDG
jgi:hypothetical protein